MTNEQWVELGRRAMACRGWRWMPGMLLRNRHTIRLANQYGNADDKYPHTYVLDGDILRDCDGEDWWFDDSEDAVPDLRDPATVGCLLALVREAHGDASGGPVPVTAADRGDTSGGPPVWFVVWSHGPCGDPFNRAEPTEAHALVAALGSAS